MRFVCVPDEESEDIERRTSDDLVRRGLVGDFAITGEPTNLHVGIQAKGVLACRLIVHGRAAHGSTPWLGDNAVLKAIDVFRRIESLPFSRESSELFDRPSINLGRIQGGDALNKVPDQCTMVLDIRYLPNQDPGDILEQIRTIPDMEVARTFIHPPAHVSRTNPYVLALGEVVGRLTSGESMSVGRDGASDAVSFLRAGVPAVEFGPTGSGHHGPEEWVSITLARALPPGADRLRAAAARAARRVHGRRRRRHAAARRRGRPRVSKRYLQDEDKAPNVGAGLVKRALLAMFLVVAMSGTALATTVVLEVDDLVDSFKKQGRVEVDIPEITRAEAGGARTIMLLGSDARYEDKKLGLKPRSDTILLVRADPDRDAIAVMSIPRDLAVAGARATAATRSTPPSRTAARG